MKHSTSFRIIFDLIVLACVFLLPWWCAGIVVLGGLVYFDRYFEILFVGFIFDSLYSGHGAGLSVSMYLFTLSAFAFVAAEILIKNRLRLS